MTELRNVDDVLDTIPSFIGLCFSISVFMTFPNEIVEILPRIPDTGCIIRFECD